MATTSEIAFVDTNVLVYGTDISSVHHVACRRLCEEGLGDERALCVSPQILAEFISVVTNQNVLPHPMTIEDARAHAEDLASSFRIIVATHGVTERFFKLLQTTGASGKRVHDILHVATMLESGIRTIYTYDAGFTRVPGILAVKP